MSEEQKFETLATACATRDGSIRPVLIAQQQDVTLYSFTLTAAQLLEFCRVERFGEHENGVNRLLSENHARNMADAMRQPDTTFAEGILGSLEGEWEYKGGRLFYGAGAYITLDDGQHRRAAIELLEEEDRKRWEFTVTVTREVPYEVRLKIFMQQSKGRAIDARLKLAMKAKLGEWASPAEERAYALCYELAYNQNSPLMGMIIMDEMDKRPYEGKHRPAGINVNGIYKTFTSLMSTTSPLSKLRVNQQLAAVKNLIRAASEVWSKSWKNPNHILTTARGINAVCKLVVSGRSFRTAVGNDYSYKHLLEVLGYAAKFDWTQKKAKLESLAALTERLDKAIGTGMARALENNSGDAEI